MVVGGEDDDNLAASADHVEAIMLQKQEIIQSLLSLKNEVLAGNIQKSKPDFRNQDSAPIELVRNVLNPTYIPHTSKPIHTNTFLKAPPTSYVQLCLKPKKVPTSNDQSIVVTSVPYCQIVDKVPTGTVNVHNQVATGINTNSKNTNFTSDSKMTENAPVGEYVQRKDKFLKNSSITSHTNSNISTDYSIESV